MASENPPWIPPANDLTSDPPPWDQEKADSVVGKYALVGVTYLASDNETVTSQDQYHGRIISADRKHGFKIACEGRWAGHTMGLPPHIEVFEPARPGDYKLHSTGEVVIDPDVLATWSVMNPVKS